MAVKKIKTLKSEIMSTSSACFMSRVYRFQCFSSFILNIVIEDMEMAIYESLIVYVLLTLAILYTWVNSVP